MSSQIIFPRHLVVSHGKFVQKKENKKNAHLPRTIQYIHTIRILNPNICNHEQIIEKLHLYYKEQIMEKDEQIEDLKRLLKSRDEQISRLDQELQRLRQRWKEDESDQEVNNMVGPHHQLEVSSIISDQYIPAKKKSFLEMFNSKIVQVDDLQVLKVKKEMRNTEEALNNVTNILRKTKKKYSFFNPHFPENSAETGGEDEASPRNSPQRASHSEGQLQFQLLTTSRVNASYSKKMNDDVNENTFESSQKKANVNRQLGVLIQQMEFMQKRYEEEIERYKALLNCEKQKNCMNILNSMGINISFDESADIQRTDSIGVRYDESQLMEGTSQLEKDD